MCMCMCIYIYIYYIVYTWRRWKASPIWPTLVCLEPSTGGLWLSKKCFKIDSFAKKGAVWMVTHGPFPGKACGSATHSRSW